MRSLRQLDYFIRIAETGSLSKAALHLHVSQAMLSRGIQELELDLGHRLFHRTGRGMELTAFGRDLLPRAQRAAMEVMRFTHEAKAMTGRLSGTVAIGLPGSVAARLVPPLLRSTVEQYPDLSLRFVEALSGGIEELLASRRLDIGLAFAREPNVARGDVTLASSHLFLVGPAGDPLTAKRSVTLAQVAQCRLLLPSRPHSVRWMVEQASIKSRCELKLLCEIDSLLAMKEIVAMGHGHTVSGYESVAREVKAGTLQAAVIRDPAIARLLVMRLGSKHAITTSSRVVADLIGRIAAELVAQGHWRAARA